VCIVGVGNCASSLIQGVEFYKNAKEDEKVPGLMNVNLGDIIFMISSSPLPFERGRYEGGTGLSEAIWAFPNNTIKFADVPQLGLRSSVE